MKLAQMQHFLAVCNHNSVTRAAAALHLSQPSVSNSIAELEREFGVNLFHRVNKRLILTREGEFFREKAQAILERAEQLTRQMEDLGNRKNNIKIGVPPMIGTFMFPVIFQLFRRKFPEINMEITEYGSVHTSSLVESDELDIAIVVLNQQITHRFNVLPILSTSLLYCVRPDHPMAENRSVSIPQLKDQPLLLFKTDSYQNAVIQQRFVEHKLEPNVLLYSSQLYTIKKFLSSSGAGAFLFREIAEMEPDLVGIPLEPPITMDIGLIWKRNKHLYSDVSRFIAFMRGYPHKELEATDLID